MRTGASAVYYRDAAAWLREGRIGQVKQAQLTLLTSGVLRAGRALPGGWSGNPSCVVNGACSSRRC